MADQPNYGSVDGEIPDSGEIRITGTGYAERGMLRGERVILTVIGEVVGVSFKKKDGRLIRTHSVKIETVNEAFAELAESIVDFHVTTADAREGRTPLKFEGGAA